MAGCTSISSFSVSGDGIAALGRSMIAPENALASAARVASVWALLLSASTPDSGIAARPEPGQGWPRGLLVANNTLESDGFGPSR